MCKRSRLKTAFDGRGAALNPGRWNGPGTAMAYAAESRSLASLEILVHTEDTQLLSAIEWVAIPVQIEPSLLEVADRLPDDWRHLPAPDSTRAFSNRWIAEERSAVLKVPSAVLPQEFNYLINPRHRDFPRLRIGGTQPLSFDPRLL